MSAASAVGQEWLVVAALTMLVLVMAAGQAVRRLLDQRRRRAMPASHAEVPAEGTIRSDQR